ncbi:hypothetical protein ACVBEE_03350 [Acinetobacter sp. ANC 3781]|jgi:hypothetical protein|uniref:hypothetical protein n=1 Tax=Acinetobacter sp. ANC 3781 TaxID=2529835 RepID=UPI00103C5724|nr:hypothetical protein [Acinetobacter sp. ANC 3781]TCB77623.1 hypothetical protein E0H89_08465 [Acinetobacter sp. ANC 3781]
MYFWRTDLLIEDLKQNRVTYADFKNYYLVSSILILLSFFALSQAETEDLKISLASLIINIGLLITWINAIFMANGGENGHAFLNRFIALYLPITIKITVFAIVAMICFELIFNIFKIRFNEAQLAHIDAIKSAGVDMATSFLIYWRICVAIKKVNS